MAFFAAGPFVSGADGTGGILQESQSEFRSQKQPASPNNPKRGNILSPDHKAIPPFQLIAPSPSLQISF